MSYEELLKSHVLYRICISRSLTNSIASSAARPGKTLISAHSLKMKQPVAAGIGVEFQVALALHSFVASSHPFDRLQVSSPLLVYPRS